MELLYKGHRFPREIISHAVWRYHRFTLSFRDVEDLLAEQGSDQAWLFICSFPTEHHPAPGRTSLGWTRNSTDQRVTERLPVSVVAWLSTSLLIRTSLGLSALLPYLPGVLACLSMLLPGLLFLRSRVIGQQHRVHRAEIRQPRNP